jgi:predicted short-subunit dehydrogenase-like oxidoreductase (DUF2520 family)
MSVTKTKKNEARLKISIVGSGRLGTALAVALSEAGYKIQALVASRRARVRKAAALLGRPVFALTADQLDQLPPTDLLIIATPDDSIAAIAQNLADLKASPTGLETVLHTSGALSVEVLAPVAKTGLNVGSMHPLVSVSDSRLGANELRGSFYCIEGDKVATRIARRLVRDLEGQAFSVNSRDKALYHASAVMASGHVVALFDVALQLLQRSGLIKHRASRVLMPLLQSTVQNVSVSTPGNSLTGTFRRGDVGTVKRHLVALRAIAEPDVLALYTRLGRWSLKLAREQGLDAKSERAIEEVLDEPEKFSYLLHEDKNESWTGCDFYSEIHRHEGMLIERALRASDGRITSAAHLLGLTHQGLADILEHRHKELLPMRKPRRSRSARGGRASRKREG